MRNAGFSPWSEDSSMEEALIKSCLLLSNKKVREQRKLLVQKKLLSLVFSGKLKSKTDLNNYSSEDTGGDFDAEQYKSALHLLKSQGLINETSDGNLTITEDIQAEAEGYLHDLINGRNQIVEEVFAKVQEAYKATFSNDTQVRSNIRKCLDYYMDVSFLNLFGIDDTKPINELARLKAMASEKLRNDERSLADIIILALGNMADSPSESQREILEANARIRITSQLIGSDEKLVNFKRSVIGSKVFFLDTDVVLYAITRHCRLSAAYKKLIEILLNCGCKILVTPDIIEEVYNHGEAATKNYAFNSSTIENAGASWPQETYKNIFINDYALQVAESNNNKFWGTYIGNYYNKGYGIDFTEDVVRNQLDTRVGYNVSPCENNIDQSILEELANKVYEETLKTEKAQHREEGKNHKVAQTDARLYLTVRKLDMENSSREGRNVVRNDLLCHKYYILTKSTRVHHCAKTIGIATDILCNPSALICYLIESGIWENSDIKLQSLFDNPFYAYIAKSSWEDISRLIEVGIDFKGMNIVKLRYDLQSNLQEILTASSPQETVEAYKNVEAKKYTLRSDIADVIADARIKSEEIEELKKQLQEQKALRQEDQKKLKQQEKIIKTGQYRTRVTLNAKRKR